MTLEQVTRPALPQVTLVAVTSVAIEATIAALQKSMQQAHFDKVLLLSDRTVPNADPAIEWRPIEPLRSRSAYSNFMLHHLAEHISTSHALCVQWDGFVLRGRAWDDSFLGYDYIGAVWPQYDDGRNVGNGGFSLRSRRLLELCGGLPADGSHAEDVVIGRHFRPMLEKAGVRFAPESVANKFAFERSAPTGNEFGFHGAYNLVRYLSRREALDVFGELESGMLAKRERREIIGWALARGRLNLARLILATRAEGIS